MLSIVDLLCKNPPKADISMLNSIPLSNLFFQVLFVVLAALVLFILSPFAPQASDDEFENLRIKGPNAVQLVKTTPVKPSPLPVIPDTIKEVIYDMLNALAAYHAPDEGTLYPGT